MMISQFIANTILATIIFCTKSRRLIEGGDLNVSNILLPGSCVLKTLFYCPNKS